MCWLSVNCGDEGVVGSWCDLGVQEGKRPILTWFLHCELYAWILCVDVLQELLTVFCLLDDKSVINKCWPQVGVWAVLRAFTSNSSMNMFAKRGLIAEIKAAPCTCS